MANKTSSTITLRNFDKLARKALESLSQGPFDATLKVSSGGEERPTISLSDINIHNQEIISFPEGDGSLTITVWEDGMPLYPGPLNNGKILVDKKRVEIRFEAYGADYELVCEVKN